MTTTIRRPILAVLAAALATLCLAAPAPAAETGSVTGTVERPTGSLTTVSVLLRSVDTSRAAGTWAEVRADGRFSVDGLAPGEYVLQYEDRAGSYLPQCYHQVAPSWDTQEPDCLTGPGPLPPTVTVSAGRTTTLETERLVFPAASLSGTVTDATGNPIDIRGETIFAVRRGEPYDEISPVLDATSKGKYVLTHLRPGAWTVFTVVNGSIWENRYSVAAPSASSARYVDLAYGRRGTADVTLRTMPKITYTASSPQKGYAAFSVKVLKANNGQPAWGDVTIAIGGQTKKATLKDGKASFRFKGLTKGANPFKISNLGNKYTANGGKRSTVTVK